MIIRCVTLQILLQFLPSLYKTQDSITIEKGPSGIICRQTNTEFFFFKWASSTITDTETIKING